MRSKLAELYAVLKIGVLPDRQDDGGMNFKSGNQADKHKRQQTGRKNKTMAVLVRVGQKASPDFRLMTRLCLMTSRIAVNLSLT